MTVSTNKSDLYWAVVEHIRTWLGEDGAFRRAIDEKKGGALSSHQPS
jgi:hypothetical protein